MTVVTTLRVPYEFDCTEKLSMRDTQWVMQLFVAAGSVKHSMTELCALCCRQLGLQIRNSTCCSEEGCGIMLRLVSRKAWMLGLLRDVSKEVAHHVPILGRF